MHFAKAWRMVSALRSSAEDSSGVICGISTSLAPSRPITLGSEIAVL
jgi:hypothetical protein